MYVAHGSASLSVEETLHAKPEAFHSIAGPSALQGPLARPRSLEGSSRAELGDSASLQKRA